MDFSAAVSGRVGVLPPCRQVQHHRQAQRAVVTLQHRAEGRRHHLHAGTVDMGGVLRTDLSVVPGGRDAGGRREFRGRHSFVARLRAAGHAVRGDGADAV